MRSLISSIQQFVGGFGAGRDARYNDDAEIDNSTGPRSSGRRITLGVLTFAVVAALFGLQPGVQAQERGMERAEEEQERGEEEKERGEEEEKERGER